MPRGKRAVPYKDESGRTFMSVKNHKVPAEVKFTKDEWKPTKVRHLERYEVRVPGTLGEVLSFLAQRGRPSSLFHPNMKRAAVRKFDDGFARMAEVLGDAQEVVTGAAQKLIRTVQNTVRRNEMDRRYEQELEKVKPIDEEALEASRETFVEQMAMVAEEEGNDPTTEELNAMFDKIKVRKLKRNAEFRAKMAEIGESEDEEDDEDEDDNTDDEEVTDTDDEE